MKHQVIRLSPHQNGKVFGVLMAIVSLVLTVPVMLFFLVSSPAAARPPLLPAIAVPFLYLLMGYLMVALGCLLYNALYRFIGGIEYESADQVT